MRRAGALLVLLAALAASGPARAATPADRAATHALLSADFALERALFTGRERVLAGERARAQALGRECAGVLHGSPAGAVEYEEELPPSQRTEPSPRQEGERDRAEQQWQQLHLEIVLTVEDSAYSAVRGALQTYVAAIEPLSWSDAGLSARIRFDAASVREILDGHGLDACADLRAWAASGFRRLPPGSVAFEAAQKARDEHFPTGPLARLLAPSESAADHRLDRRIAALRRDVARALEATREPELRLDLALGLKETPEAEQELEPVIAHGSTGAGSTFEIQPLAKAHRLLERGCPHGVYVTLIEGRSSSSGTLCLGAHRGPSGECAGQVETIKLGTTPAVASVSITLSDGQTRTVRPTPVPQRGGGPGGVVIAAFRGGRQHPVSLREIGAGGRVLHTFDVRSYRCDRPSPYPTGLHGEPGPSSVTLASALAPSGQRVYFSATVFKLEGRTEFSLDPVLGRSGRERAEVGSRTSHTFAWSLSGECQPNGFASIEGILKAPGASVSVRTPAGLVALTKAELDPKLGAGGPLFYGVFAAAPTELVVLRADGSTLYTESLGARAREEAEYCEGFAEPSS